MKKFLLLFIFAFCIQEMNAQALTVAIASSTNVNCNSGCDGVATAVANGGAGGYVYLWTPTNQTSTTATNLCAGVYTVTVTDALMATASATVVITQPTALNVGFTPANWVFCAPGSVGFISNVTGGTLPYAYSWNFTGGTPSTSTVANPTVNWNSGGAFNVSMIVTDANGCNATFTTTITGDPLSFTGVAVTPANYCDSQIVTLNPSGFIPGYGPYNFMAAPNSAIGNNVFALASTYTLTITDADGCVASGTTTLSPNPNTLVANITTSAPQCNQFNGTISSSPTGGTSPYTFLWSPGNQTTSSITGQGPGNYFLTITDNVGCPISRNISFVDSCYYVYPGDANDDGIADNNDILDIGIANGATGSIRSSANISWTPQANFSNWGQTLLSGTDYKYVDCDGNGTIQNADTNAVVQNFGFTHVVRTGPVNYDATLPDLSIHLNQDSLGAGWPGSLSVSLGSSSVPASNVYGVAFTLNFNAAEIDANSFGMNNSSSWMGTVGNNLMGVVLKPATGNGFVEVAITRYDHADAAGFGNIADLGFMTTNALSGTGNMQNVNFTISNVTIISSNETIQNVNLMNDSVVVADAAMLTGISQDENENNSISIYPNPFEQSTTIVLPASISRKQNEIVITDLQGRIIQSEKVSSANYILQRGNLDQGIYFCTVKSEGKVVGVTKIIVK